MGCETANSKKRRVDDCEQQLHVTPVGNCTRSIYPNKEWVCSEKISTAQHNEHCHCRGTWVLMTQIFNSQFKILLRVGNNFPEGHSRICQKWLPWGVCGGSGAGTQVGRWGWRWGGRLGVGRPLLNVHVSELFYPVWCLYFLLFNGKRG